jgi:sulfite exporter TauE/SafE
MELCTALLLGLVGSLHCAGMCGPLALALPRAGKGTTGLVLSRVAYNTGRLSAYALLGVVFGLVGRTVALSGFQRWASLTAGSVILLALVPAWNGRLSWPAVRGVSWLKTGLSSLLQRRTLGSLYLLGVLNGFLPCGLVYVACAAAVALGGIVLGVGYMVAFGLGTFPMMLGIGLLGNPLQTALRLRYQRLVPVGLGIVGALLIVRGLDLGIPYLSPNLSGSCCGHACH